MSILNLHDCDIKGKRVLIREDFNVPIRNGMITSDKRLQAALPTIKLAIENGARITLMSHLGRPKPGQFDAEFSLAPVAEYLAQALDLEVKLINFDEAYAPESPNIIHLLENVRFLDGELDNCERLGKLMANLCDVFIMDAFGCAHRAHASTYQIAKFAPVACAGLLLESELKALKNILQAPKHPIVAIVGGSKVSSKLKLLEELVKQVDTLIVGGGIANTFLKAKGFDIGASMYEPELVDSAKAIMATKTLIPLPEDVVVAKSLSECAPAYTKPLHEVASDDMILDFGSQTLAKLSPIISEANTILWNGPIGVFEYAPFSYGTRTLAFNIAESDAYSVAGGGDTLAAIDKFDISKDISYISTGGGAFLEYLEGRELPAVEALNRN